MSHNKMMRWSKTHRKGVRQAWCGFHTGLHNPKLLPQPGSKEWFVNEALLVWKQINRCFKERGEGQKELRREIIREDIAIYRELVAKAGVAPQSVSQ